MLRQTFSQPFRAYLVVLAIIFAASTGPIFIRNAQQAGAPSLYIIAVRLILASLILAPIVLKKHRKQLAGLPLKEWLLVAVSGFFFALNLLLLFLALEFTSVLAIRLFLQETS
jgi:drug/metabolite transporter (DMT)-like permease